MSDYNEMDEEEITALETRINTVLDRAKQESNNEKNEGSQSSQNSNNIPSTQNSVKVQNMSPGPLRRVPPPPPPRPANKLPPTVVPGVSSKPMQTSSQSLHVNSDSSRSVSCDVVNNESICPQCSKVMTLSDGVYECSVCQTSILALSSIMKPRFFETDQGGHRPLTHSLTLSEIASGIESGNLDSVNDYNFVSQPSIPLTSASYDSTFVASHQPSHDSIRNMKHTTEIHTSTNNNGPKEIDLKSFLRQSDSDIDTSQHSPRGSLYSQESKEDQPHQPPQQNVFIAGQGENLKKEEEEEEEEWRRSNHDDMAGLQTLSLKFMGDQEEDGVDDGAAPIRLLKKAKESEAEWKKRRERMVQEAEEEFKATHPFKPTIPKYKSKHTSRISASSENQQYFEKSARKNTGYWEDAKKEEEKELTFKPKVNKWPKANVIKKVDPAAQAYVSKPVYERLSHGLSPKVVREYLTIKEKRDARDRLRRQKYPDDYLSEEEELKRRREKQLKREQRERQEIEKLKKSRDLVARSSSNISVEERDLDVLSTSDPIHQGMQHSDQSPMTPPRPSLPTSSSSSASSYSLNVNHQGENKGHDVVHLPAASSSLSEVVQSLPPPITAFPVPTPTPSPPSSVSSDSSIRSDERLLASSPSSGAGDLSPNMSSPATNHNIVDSPLSLASQSGRITKEASPIQGNLHFSSSPISNISSNTGSGTATPVAKKKKREETGHVGNKLVHGVKITANQHRAIFASLYGGSSGGVGATTGAGIIEPSGSAAAGAAATASKSSLGIDPSFSRTSSFHAYSSQANTPSQVRNGLNRTPQASQSKLNNSTNRSSSNTPNSTTENNSNSKSMPREEGGRSLRAYMHGAGTPLGELHTPQPRVASSSDALQTIPPTDGQPINDVQSFRDVNDDDSIASSQSPSIASPSSGSSLAENEEEEEEVRQSLNTVFNNNRDTVESSNKGSSSRGTTRGSQYDDRVNTSSKYFTAMSNDNIDDGTSSSNPRATFHHGENEEDAISGEESDKEEEDSSDGFSDFLEESEFYDYRPSLAALGIRSLAALFNPMLWQDSQTGGRRALPHLLGMDAKTRQKFELKVAQAADKYSGGELKNGSAWLDDDERFMLGGGGDRMQVHGDSFDRDNQEEMRPRVSQSAPRSRRQFNQAQVHIPPTIATVSQRQPKQQQQPPSPSPSSTSTQGLRGRSMDRNIQSQNKHIERLRRSQSQPRSRDMSRERGQAGVQPQVIDSSRSSVSRGRTSTTNIPSTRATRSISSDQLFELHYEGNNRQGRRAMMNSNYYGRDRRKGQEVEEEIDDASFIEVDQRFDSFIGRLKQCEKRSEERKALLEKKYTPDFQPFLISRHKGAKLRETNMNQTKRNPPTRRSRSASPYRSRNNLNSKTNDAKGWQETRDTSTSFDNFMEQARGSSDKGIKKVGKDDGKKGGNNTVENDENEDANLKIGNKKSPASSSNRIGPSRNNDEEKDADVFQRLGVFEVLRRREMAKLKAARRQSIAHYKSKNLGEDGTSFNRTKHNQTASFNGEGGVNDGDFQQYHQTFLKSGVSPMNPSQYLIPQHLDPDECSFNPMITAKAKRLPKRTGEDMCRDALIYSEKRKQLVVVDSNKQSEMEPFKPNFETKVNPEKNPSSKFVKKATTTISKKQEPTSCYIERLREKAETKERIRIESQRKKELEELEGCTFEPDLPPCPQFIHQLADGFKKAKETVNKKKYNDIYEGKNSKYKKTPDWQTVSVTEGSVYGARWGKVIITDPSVQLATCTRSIVKSMPRAKATIKY